jgi:hypothetical protein
MKVVTLSAIRTGRLYSPREDPWYSFLLQAALTTGPQCSQRDFVTEKCQRTRREFFRLNSFSCSLFVLYPYLFLCLYCSSFCLLSFLTTHKTNIYSSGGILFLYSLVLCTSSLLLPLCSLSSILRFVFTYNTQHKHPCPRRDSKPRPQTLVLDRSTTGVGNRTRDLPVCSAVRQPTALPTKWNCQNWN